MKSIKNYKMNSLSQKSERFCCNLIKTILLGTAFFFSQSSIAQSFFESHREGWFWYQDPKKTITPQVPSIFPFQATEMMKALQKRVEDNLNLAILYPTEENLKNYAVHYQEVTNQAQRFTDAYQLMMLKNPALDYSLQFPVNPLAQTVYSEEKERLIEKAVKVFAANHGLFFFFKGSCHYCQVFAPIIKQFSEKHKLTVIAITTDGKTLPEFPDARKDQYASMAFKVKTLPALFAVNPRTQEVTAITHKPLSLYELEENILRLMQAKGREEGLL